jgi:hypothetical protein
MGGGFYPEMRYEKPPFELPVVYEDDHFAIGTSFLIIYTNRCVSSVWDEFNSFVTHYCFILCCLFVSLIQSGTSKVNKPAGIVVYSHRGGGHGSMTVRAQLPFVLRPPAVGTRSVIRRPQTCHRLDKPTSGLVRLRVCLFGIITLIILYHFFCIQTLRIWQ